MWCLLLPTRASVRKATLSQLFRYLRTGARKVKTMRAHKILEGLFSNFFKKEKHFRCYKIINTESNLYLKCTTITLNEGELNEHQVSAVAVMAERRFHYCSSFKS